ncbi:VUT family protein [Fictibacillus phosphorivorans]|uniref:VUT family protein n=1 Tax=Fictibacillus phosphorivorans TaxID=1221500 RepID=UPI00203C3E32|nr:VUT family protein [Fictibacillus phosphorivorans]MCM3720047.1 VUT family protein [Fictibacillus phosphorivorans]MCM3777754.1 VUT family protein [Fictibacillus phosphorivorans]
MNILFYLLVIVTANVVTASTMPLVAGKLIIPYGTFFIGLTFILRDLVQRKVGKKKTYGVIAIALLASALTSYLLGDTLYIAAASALTFVLSESIDTEIYSRMNAPFYKRVLYSGAVSSLVDSTIFVIVGLSPIGAGFLSWDLVPYAILGQYLVKLLIQVFISMIMRKQNTFKELTSN